MLSVTKIMEFESAHCLENHKGKCKNLHGHSYKLEITIGLSLIGKNEGYFTGGMVIDFGDLKDIMKEMVDKHFDHQNINDWFDGPATAENMILWIRGYMHLQLPESNKLLGIKLWETSTSYAEWRAE